MECAEKVVIACYLLDEGLDGASVAGFVSAMEGGCARGEHEAVALREAFKRRQAKEVPGGVLGDVVRLMVAKMELDEVRREFDLGVGGLREVERLIAHVPQNRAGARTAARRVVDVLRDMAAG